MELDIIELCKGISAVLAAAGSITTIVVVIVKWFNKQNQQSKDIDALRAHHDEDNQKIAKELTSIKDELCILSYAMLASLDGLKQQGCNGNVTRAHNMLEKHLNQRAHDQ